MKAVHLIEDVRKINNIDLSVMPEACGQYILSVSQQNNIPVQVFEKILESWIREYKIAMQVKE